MFIFSSILIYFSSIIIAISAMTFVVLATVADEVSKRRQLFYLMCFCASNFLIETLYLCMTVQDSLLHYYHYNVFMRVADTVLYTVQTYSWCRFMLFLPSKRVYAGRPCGDPRFGTMFCSIQSGLALIISVVTYAVFIDDQFLFTGNIGIAGEVISSALLTIVLIYIAATRSNATGSNHFNISTLLITAALIIIQWWTCIFMIVESYLELPFEIHEYLTGAVQQMFVIIVTAMYVYRPDYSHKTLKVRITELLRSQEAKAYEHTATADVPLSVDSELPVHKSAKAYAGNEAASLMCPSAASDGQTYAAEEPAVNAASVVSEAVISAGGTDAALDAASTVSRSVIHTADTGTALDAQFTAAAVIAESAAADAADDLDAAGNTRAVPDGRVDAAFIAEDDSEIAAVLSTAALHEKLSPAAVSHSLDTDAHASAAELPDEASRIDRLFDEKLLTRREREVAKLAYAGLTNPEIADRLFISQYTVKRHMHSIFEKFNISARIELVHFMNGM